MISNYAFRRTNFQEARLSYEVLELDHPFRSTIGRLALVQRFDFLFMVFDLFSMYRDEQLNLSYLYLPRVLCNQSYIFFQVVINLQWKEYNFHTIGHIINLLKGGYNYQDIQAILRLIGWEFVYVIGVFMGRFGQVSSNLLPSVLD